MERKYQINIYLKGRCSLKLKLGYVCSSRSFICRFPMSSAQVVCETGRRGGTGLLEAPGRSAGSRLQIAKGDHQRGPLRDQHTASRDADCLRFRLRVHPREGRTVAETRQGRARQPGPVGHSGLSVLGTVGHAKRCSRPPQTWLSRWGVRGGPRLCACHPPRPRLVASVGPRRY